MSRLIEVDDVEQLPSGINLEKGDLLRLTASGGHVWSGNDVVELLGPFIPGIIKQNGEIISPAGAPGVIMFLAKKTGQAEINVVTGDPWHSPLATKIKIVVRP